MAQASYPPPAFAPTGAPVTVVGSQFCAPYPVDLSVVRKLLKVTEGNFAVTDVNGNVMFTVKGKFFSLHDKRVLLDAAGTPLLTLKQKALTMHRRWEAFRGESTDSKDLMFSVRKSSMLQFKTQLDVFLAANSKEDYFDFKIKGSWLERSCTITLGDSSTIIAQMHRKHTASSILLGKDNFGVTVYPNVDYAFIVALVVILEEINEDRSGED